MMINIAETPMNGIKHAAVDSVRRRKTVAHTAPKIAPRHYPMTSLP